MEDGLMEIVRSLNRSWIYDTYFSLYRATCIHPGGKFGGKYPDTDKDVGLGSRIVLDGCTSCWNYLRAVGLSLLLYIESCSLFAFTGLWLGLHRHSQVQQHGVLSGNSVTAGNTGYWSSSHEVPLTINLIQSQVTLLLCGVRVG